MGRTLIDLSGRRFGMWTVLEVHWKYLSPTKRVAFWKCRCDCGTERLVWGEALKKGAKSCGCARFVGPRRPVKSLVGAARVSHGRTGTPEHFAWIEMIARCENTKKRLYKNYGGRGIVVCDRWRHSFVNFLSDMGERPSPQHSLDRIDNDGNYEPGNCRWADVETQQNNRRDCVKITCRGKIMTLTQWARASGRSTGTIKYRLSKGRTAEDAIFGELASSRRTH